MKVRSLVPLLSLTCAASVACGHASAGIAYAASVPKIDANVGLSSLISLSDGHLQKIADEMTIAAKGDAARTFDWNRIQPLLEDIAKTNVEADFWFARPDGTYWTLKKGKSAQNLSDRPYFPKVIAGRTIIGELVVSRSTSRNVAVVATPIRGKNGAIGGVLGASVWLDRLSERLEHEMGLDRTTIYFSFNSSPQIGLNWDPTLIFSDPRLLGPEVSQAFDAMMKKSEGVESYTFREKPRTVVFRKSKVTDWWYAFGVVPTGRESAPEKIANSG